MMKNYIYILAVIIGLSSCSSSNEEKVTPVNFSVNEFPMEYELTEFSTMLAGSQVTGDDLPYREKYVFREDLTFTKSRTENGQTMQADGNYSKENSNDEENFKLIYNSANELVENCLPQDNTEYLIIDSPVQIRGTANACDYPSKTYKRVK